MEDENVTDFANEITIDGLDSSQNSNQYTFVVLGWFLMVCGIFENVFICWILICKKRSVSRAFPTFIY